MNYTLEKRRNRNRGLQYNTLPSYVPRLTEKNEENVSYDARYELLTAVIVENLFFRIVPLSTFVWDTNISEEHAFMHPRNFPPLHSVTDRKTTIAVRTAVK
jgi:hypothetical protein